MLFDATTGDQDLDMHDSLSSNTPIHMHVYMPHAPCTHAEPHRATLLTKNPMHSFDRDVVHGHMHEEDYSKFGQKSQTRHDASPRRRLMHVRLAKHAPAIGDPTCACVALPPTKASPPS